MTEGQQKLQQAEGLNNSIRLELLSSDTERRQLRDAVGHQDREIQQVTYRINTFTYCLLSELTGQPCSCLSLCLMNKWTDFNDFLKK